MNDLTHPGLLSIWPVWGSPRRRCSQHLASFLSKTLFFPFLFSHRDRPAASYDFYIWRLFHHGFPEKLKTLLVIKGATCWSMPVSIYWERSLSGQTSYVICEARIKWKCRISFKNEQDFEMAITAQVTCPQSAMNQVRLLIMDTNTNTKILLSSKWKKNTKILKWLFGVGRDECI